MTIQELIDELQKVENKSKEVIIGVLSENYYYYQGVNRVKEYDNDITIFTNN